MDMATHAGHGAAIEQARCLGCGYCLYGLDRRCPECGRGFSARDATTFKRSGRRIPESPLGMVVVGPDFPCCRICGNAGMCAVRI